MMEVKYITVIEKPKSCRLCIFSRLKPRKNSLFDLECIATGKYTKTKKIPDWCPLIVERQYKTLDDLICATPDEEGYNCETFM